MEDQSVTLMTRVTGLTCTGRNRDIDTGASVRFFCFFFIKYLKRLRGSEEDYLLAIESSNFKKKEKTHEIYPQMRLRLHLHLCSLPNFKQTLTYFTVWSGSHLLRMLIGLTLHLICSVNCMLSKYQTHFLKDKNNEEKACDNYKFTLWSSAAIDNMYEHRSVICMKCPEAEPPQSQPQFRKGAHQIRSVLIRCLRLTL